MFFLQYVQLLLYFFGAYIYILFAVHNVWLVITPNYLWHYCLFTLPNIISVKSAREIRQVDSMTCSPLYSCIAPMMPTISKLAGLSRKYTNHCVTTTAMTFCSDSNIPSRHIMSISGHKNEQSLAHYNCRPTFTQLEVCSDVLAITINKGTQHKLQMDSSTAPTAGISTASKVLPPFPVQPFIQSVLGELNGYVLRSCQICSHHELFVLFTLSFMAWSYTPYCLFNLTLFRTVSIT